MASQHNLSVSELIGQIRDLPKEETMDTYKVLLENLENIVFPSEVEPWLHPYYKAICLIRMGFIEPNNAKKDYYFDKAEKLTSEALKAAPKESEIYVLRALMNQGRILVSMIARGMQYISSIEADLRKAKRLDGDNPRAYFLLGQSYLNKPALIGGSKQMAKFHFKKAKERFAKQHELYSAYHPAWGNWQNEEELEKL